MVTLVDSGTQKTISRTMGIKIDPLRAVNISMRKGMGHTAVSTTQASSVNPKDLATWSQAELL